MFLLSYSGVLAKYFYSADSSLSKIGNQSCKKNEFNYAFLAPEKRVNCFR